MSKDFVGMVSHDVMQGRGPDTRKGGGTTYPGSSSDGGASSFIKRNDVRARYKMFDLCKQSEVAELEDLMTAACAGTKMIREERWSHDKDGLTVVTVSWLDVTPKKSKKPQFSPEDEEDEEDEDDPAGISVLGPGGT